MLDADTLDHSQDPQLRVFSMPHINFDFTLPGTYCTLTVRTLKLTLQANVRYLR